MFHSARLKLTAWYLLIIMFISVSFSVAMYKVLTFELNRMERMQRLRIERGLSEPRRIIPPEQPFRIDPDLVDETQNHLQFILLVINLGILGSSAVAGYFLAGKTLKPIEKAMEEQKRFVADASHEMRTPLTALKTSMEVALRDKRMSLPEAKEVIKSNLEDIDGLKSLSDNLLSLAHYQSNGQKLIFKELDIKEVMKNVHRKILPLVKQKGVDVKLEIESQTIRGDKESLEEMMLIFLDNAVKYTPSGGKITVTAERKGKLLSIKVKDTGIGISRENIPHIFDRFYQVDRSRSKDKVAGFGLGLSLAKKIIEMYKGSVEVVSVLGKGATFTIKLPLSP